MIIGLVPLVSGDVTSEFFLSAASTSDSNFENLFGIAGRNIINEDSTVRSSVL